MPFYTDKNTSTERIFSNIGHLDVSLALFSGAITKCLRLDSASRKELHGTHTLGG